MALGNSQPTVGRIRGKLGDVVYKWYGDRLVVTRAPRPSSSKPTKRQQAGRGRFQEASRYAERARKDPAVWSLYEAAAKRRGVPTRAMAIHDFLTAPAIVGVSAVHRAEATRVSVLTGDRHTFKTVGVLVTIFDGGGRTLETGAATTEGRSAWGYTLQGKSRDGDTLAVEAVARDRFGKTTRARFTGVVGAPGLFQPAADARGVRKRA